MRPKDQSMNKHFIVLGVLAALVIAGLLFSLGAFYIGPKMRTQMEATHTTRSAPTYTPPAQPRRDAPRVLEPEVEITLDADIVERGDEIPEAVEDSRPSGRGVRRDGNTLTLDLEPTERDKSQRERSDSHVRIERAEQTRDHQTPDLSPPRVATEQKSTSTTDKAIYKVQAGTFANKSNADELAADLRKKGYKPEISTVHLEDRTLHRVQVGGYSQQEDARELANDLTADGYSPTVVQTKKSE